MLTRSIAKKWRNLDPSPSACMTESVTESMRFETCAKTVCSYVFGVLNFQQDLSQQSGTGPLERAPAGTGMGTGSRSADCVVSLYG